MKWIYSKEGKKQGETYDKTYYKDKKEAERIEDNEQMKNSEMNELEKKE